MLKALLKKQWIANVSTFANGKDGKRRSMGALVGLCGLALLLLASMSFMFYTLGEFLCPALVAMGLEWLYFALMGTMAMALGIIMSIFLAKSELYEAKDNDLLFSMPIPPWMVLFARMTGMYLTTLLFEALVFLPGVAAYLILIGFSFPVLACSLLVLLLMPFGTLGICCVLGWLIALLSAKLPWKNLLTVVFSVSFMVVYFIVYSKINTYLTYVLQNGGLVAAKVKTWLFPFWKLGQGCVGNVGALALYALMFLGVFGLVYWLISCTYLRLVTTSRGGKKAKYKSTLQKQGRWQTALLKKELMRFIKNPMVAMNSFLGTIFFLVLPFVVLFVEELRALGGVAGIDEILAMIGGVVLCLVGTMNICSSASVSLEGESIWIVRSLPVKTENVLFIKAAFHWLVTAIPALFAGVFLAIVLRVDFWFSAGMIFVVLAYITFSDLLGLTVNLKMPNMHWTNEVQAVKQGMAGMLSMFAEWAVLGLLVDGYFLVGKYLFAGGYFLVCIALLCILCGVLGWWIETRGKEIFESL